VSGILQRGQDAHQRGLARAVGPQQPVHPRRDGEAHVVERLHAVRVGLGDVADVELHGRIQEIDQDGVGAGIVRGSTLERAGRSHEKEERRAGGQGRHFIFVHANPHGA
jgi:hypothetical protein